VEPPGDRQGHRDEADEKVGEFGKGREIAGTGGRRERRRGGEEGEP